MVEETSKWIAYDYDAGFTDERPTDDLVFIIDQDAYVTLGYHDGFTWCRWNGSDDVSVSHWMPLEVPALPADFPDLPEDD